MSRGVLRVPERVPHATPHAIAEFINEHVTYKPGYVFRADVPRGEVIPSVRLTLGFIGRDSRDQLKLEQNLTFARSYPVSTVIPMLEFVEMIVSCHVHEWEVHEADEWLRVDGQMIRDPHE